MKDYNRAAAVLEKKAPVKKNGRYYFRKGRLSLRTGKVVTALENLRMVQPADKRVYPSAKMLIGEICASSKRYLCAEKEYSKAAETEDYADVAKGKIAKLEDSKKTVQRFFQSG